MDLLKLAYAFIKGFNTEFDKVNSYCKNPTMKSW